MCIIDHQRMEVRKDLASHDDPADGQSFLASLTEQQQLLHRLAKERLGSSYFMEKTNSYRKWKAAAAAAASASTKK